MARACQRARSRVVRDRGVRIKKSSRLAFPVLVSPHGQKEAVSMGLPRWAPRIPRRSPVRAVAAAIGGPLGATLLALALPHHGPASAASLYMIGVVAAAVYGGRVGWRGRRNRLLRRLQLLLHRA